MRLIINRRQADVKGLLGGNKGVSFTLSYRLELNAEERGLVERYKLQNYALTWTSGPQGRIPDDTIANMTTGRSQTLNDVTTLLRNEDIVKDACDNLILLFKVCRNFGGDEIVDYPRT
jgi:hypothetical protein